MSVPLQCAPSIEKVHVVYDFPWLLCVIDGCVVLCVQTGTALSIRARPFPVCSQSLLLTLWLLAFTTGFLFTALACLVSGIHTLLSRFEVAI